MRRLCSAVLVAVDPIKLKPWIHRAILLSVIAAGLVMYNNYGWLRVPKGMDTMPDELPGGTLCLIEKRPSEVVVGSVVFVDLPQGGTVVTRVREIVGDDLIVQHDNPKSRLGFADGKGAVSIEWVRGLVLSGFLE